MTWLLANLLKECINNDKELRSFQCLLIGDNFFGIGDDFCWQFTWPGAGSFKRSLIFIT